MNVIREHSALPFAAVVVLALACTSASFAAETKQETFATPEKAVSALIAATKAGNKAALLKILGPKADKLINSGDVEADKEDRKKFQAAYDAKHSLEKDGEDEQVLIVGEKEWPLPIPLVRENGKWRFDTTAGEGEILDRRIGHNELNVIEVCRAYVEAQNEYALAHKSGKKPEYAQRFLSSEGKQDGLYWPVADGEQESPLGPLIAFAVAEGNPKATPYHGYYYKILTSQSENAPEGKVDYLTGGHMTKGFGMIAYPAKYGDSGIMTFIVNDDGIVREKDLGPDTAKLAAQISTYDPDNSWKLP